MKRLEIEPTLVKAEWSSDLSHDLMQYYLFFNIKGAETSRMKMTEENAIILEGLIPDTEYDLIIEGWDSKISLFNIYTTMLYKGLYIGVEHPV